MFSPSNHALLFVASTSLGCFSLVVWRQTWLWLWRNTTPLEWQEDEAVGLERRMVVRKMAL